MCRYRASRRSCATSARSPWIPPCVSASISASAIAISSTSRTTSTSATRKSTYSTNWKKSSHALPEQNHSNTKNRPAAQQLQGGSFKATKSHKSKPSPLEDVARGGGCGPSPQWKVVCRTGRWLKHGIFPIWIDRSIFLQQLNQPYQCQMLRILPCHLYRIGHFHQFLSRFYSLCIT